MQLRIWHKIFIGVAIPSIIAITGSIIAYGYIRSTIERQRFVQIADDLKEDILELRRNEKNFIHFKDEKQMQNVLNAISHISESLNAISDPSLDEAGNKDINFLQTQSREYSSVLQRQYASYQSEYQVVEWVRTEGRKLETLISSDSDPEGIYLSLILHLRLLEKNYMLFRDKESLRNFEDGLLELKNIMPLCFQCKAYLKSVNSLTATYRTSDSLADKLQMIGDNLEKSSTQISNRERQMISHFLDKSQRLILFAVALLFILVPFFIYKTASYIVAPIKRLVDITGKISEGNTSLRASLKEHDETYDLAISFNKMLDNMLSTRESLERTVELLHKKQTEIEKRASLGFLISGVTHELNNPLNNISLTAETIKEEINELSQKELSEFVQDILTQSERAKYIIDDLLDFAGARKIQDMDKMDIVNAIEEAVNLTANELRMNNIMLEMDIPNTPYFIRGIKSKLLEVFVNIIVNAIHAIDGKGKLTIRSWPDENNNMIYIQISDTGHGIPEEIIKNIFEPFYTTKEVGEGTGLGLSVSQGIINDHNGDIDVKSNTGEGTTFIIRLPLYKEVAER